MNVLMITFIGLALISAAISAEPAKDREELEKLYRKPIQAINTMMLDATIYCQRLPLKQEFQDFVSDGKHKDIECIKKVGSYVNEPKKPNEQYGISRYVVGQLIPYFTEFLKNKQYEVISDTKQIYIILKHDPNKWKYPDINKSEYEYVVSCLSYLKECKFDRLNGRIKKCKSDITFPQEHCYFGSNKIIDFQTGKINPASKPYRYRLLSNIHDTKERNRFIQTMQQTKMVYSGGWNRELYYLPIEAIGLIFEYSSKYCERFPSETEFNDFVLNKFHKNIKCTKELASTEYKRLLDGRLGMGNPTLTEFIERNQYQYYSDQKNLALVSRPVFKAERFHKFRSETYDTVLRCSHTGNNCGTTPLKNVIEGCLKFKERCYLGNKKIIDYNSTIASKSISSDEFPYEPPAPKNSRQAEEQELNEFYLHPLKGIQRILEVVVRHCNRPPKESEFKGLVLAGDLGGLRCKAKEVAKIKEIIKTNFYINNFLEQYKYEILADPYVFYFILKNDPEKWKFKYFTPGNVDNLFSCEIEREKCSMGTLSSRIQRCKGENVPEYCYLNGKKIFSIEKDK